MGRGLGWAGHQTKKHEGAWDESMVLILRWPFFTTSVLQKLRHSLYLLGKLHIMIVLLFIPATLPASLHSQNKSII